MFIFNTDLLLINVTWYQAIFVFIIATIGILVFTAGTMNWFITRSKLWETVALLLVAFTLFRPGYFMNMVEPPYTEIPPANIVQRLDKAPVGRELRLVFSGPDYDTGVAKDTTVLVKVPEGTNGQEKLDKLGLSVTDTDGKMVADEPMFGTELQQKLQGFDFYGDTPVTLSNVKVPNDQLPKELMFIPAFLLLGLVAFLQYRRKEDDDAAFAQGETA